MPRVEDENAFANYVRLPPHMFDELLNRISPVIQRRDTHMKVDVGMKLAMTIRHQATGDRYHSMISDVATAQWYGVCRKFVRPS